MFSRSSSSNSPLHTRHHATGSSRTSIGADGFECVIRSEITISLWNRSEGLPVSQGYDNSNASRLFKENDDEQTSLAFRRTREILRKSNWKSIAPEKSYSFHSLEADVLIHLADREDNQAPKFDERLSAIPPPKSNNPQKSHESRLKQEKKKISDNALLPPNGVVPTFYCLFEVTLDPSLILVKLAQLERLLTFLLERKRIQQLSMAHLGVLDIARLVGVACHKRASETIPEIQAILESHSMRLPLLYKMFRHGRLCYFQVSANQENLLNIINRLDAENKELKQENQILKQEIQILKQENQILKQENQVLKQENQVLKQENQILNQKVDSLNEKVELLAEQVTKLLSRTKLSDS